MSWWNRNYFKNLYNTGEIIIENIDIQSNIIKEILNGNIEKSGILSVNGYEEYIFNLINGNPQKLDIALKNNFINNKFDLIKIVNSIKEPLNLSKFSFDLMKDILLKSEYTSLELLTLSFPKESENKNFNQQKNNLENIIFDKLKKDTDIFIDKITKIKYFQNDLSKIENLLKQDIQAKKDEYDWENQWMYKNNN